MIIIVIVILIAISTVFITYRFSVKPKRQIKRFVNVCRSLGYTVYEQPFTFMGYSTLEGLKKGFKEHKDALYVERTVFPQVDIVVGNAFDKLLIHFINPELIKTFLNGITPYNYPKYQVIIKGQKTVFGNGLAFNEGDVWKNKRKILSNAFNFQLMKQNIPKITQICNKTLDLFQSTHNEGQNVYKYNPMLFAHRLFNSVILKCFFGTDQVNTTINGQQFGQFVKTTMKSAVQFSYHPLVALFGDYAWKAGVTSSIREAKKNVDLLKQKTTQIIKEVTERVMRQPRKEKTSIILQSLIYLKLDNKDQMSLTDEQLVYDFQGFMVGGSNTTSSFNTMMVFYLVNNPPTLKKLREQIDLVIKSDEDITYQNLKKLIYIDWCQLETTRLFGPANGIFPRIASEDNNVNDIPISKGTVVSYQPRGNHYSPKYFKDPNQFRPERWESECNNIHPFALVGFSAGLRSCIGKQFAYLQSKIALIKFIKRYEDIQFPQQVALNLISNYSPQPFDAVLTKKTDQQQ